MLKKLKIWLNEIKVINRKPVMGILPGQLAFFFVLSIPPLILLIAIIGGMFSISTESFLSFINDAFPAKTSSIIVPIIQGKGLGLSAIFFIFGALFMISNATNAIIVTSNTLYNTNESSTIRRQIKSLFLVIILLLLFAFIIIVPAFGDLIISLIGNISYFDNIYDQILVFYSAIKLPMSFLFIYFIIKVIYTVAPDKDIKSKEVTYGALFTTILWIIATQAYSYYVTNFASYNLFYGSIANLIILLLWIYLLSYIFVLGMALNAGTHQVELNSKKRT